MNLPPPRLTRRRLIAILCLASWFGIASAGGAQNPAITSLSRYSGAPGSDVVINGAGFSPSAADNQVAFGAVQVAVASASATQLVTHVPYGATFAPVTVRVPSGKTAASARPFIPVFSPAGSIADRSFGQALSGAGAPPAMVNFSTDVSSVTRGSCIVDLDGDGRPDVAVAQPSSSSLRIFRNTHASGNVSSASLTSALNLYIPSGASLQDVAAADLNGDGKPDLAVVGIYGVKLLQNSSVSGTISLFPAVTLPVPDTARFGVQSVKIADVDGDGWPDLVCGGDQIVVYRNQGLGGTLSASSFAAGVVYFPAGASGSDLAIADLDGDGKPDVLTSGYPAAFIILRNTATPGTINAASFAAPLQIALPTLCSALAAADLDGDGKPELIVAAGGLYVFPNQSAVGSLSAASFGAPASVPLPSSPQISRLAVGDLNGDGWLDLAITSRVYPAVSIAVNGGSGVVATAFSTLASLAIPPGVNGDGSLWGDLAIGDLNADGRPDLVLDGFYSRIAVSQNYVAPMTVSSATLNPNSATVTIPWYRTAPFTLSEVMSDGGKVTVIKGATWTSSNPAVASVDTNGLTTGLSPGMTAVRSDFGGGNAQATVTVRPVAFGLNAGNPDAGFVPVVANGGAYGAVYAMAVQPDGKVIVGGLFSTVNGVPRRNLARLNSDGSLDASFDPGAGPDSTVYGLALDSAGRVVIGGAFSKVNGVARPRAARLQRDGSLDSSFNANFSESSYYVKAVALRPNGQILLGGYELTLAGNGQSTTYLLQLNDNGARDSAFTAETNTAYGDLDAMVIQPDGNLLIAGSFSAASASNFALGRLTPTGALDPAFQVGIKSSRVHGIAWQPDGKIVAVGDFTQVFDQAIRMVTRVNDDGTLDPSFSKTVATKLGHRGMRGPAEERPHRRQQLLRHGAAQPGRNRGRNLQRDGQARLGGAGPCRGRRRQDSGCRGYFVGKWCGHDGDCAVARGRQFAARLAEPLLHPRRVGGGSGAHRT